MNITVFKLSTGQIARSVDCPEQDKHLQFEAATQGYIDGNYPDDQFYIANGQPVAIPARPSEIHTFNWVTKQWGDPRTLQDFKEAQWTLIKQARSQAEYAGFTWDGSVFDSDAISQNRITGAVTLATLSPEFTINWVLADNTVRTLNQTDMMQVGAALGQHVALQFNKAVLLRSAIESATSAEEVLAIQWTV